MIRCSVLQEIIALLPEAAAPKDKILLTQMVTQNQEKVYRESVWSPARLRTMEYYFPIP